MRLTLRADLRFEAERRRDFEDLRCRDRRPWRFLPLDDFGRRRRNPRRLRPLDAAFFDAARDFGFDLLFFDRERERDFAGVTTAACALDFDLAFDFDLERARSTAFDFDLERARSTALDFDFERAALAFDSALARLRERPRLASFFSAAVIRLPAPAQRKGPANPGPPLPSTSAFQTPCRRLAFLRMFTRFESRPNFDPLTWPCLLPHRNRQLGPMNDRQRLLLGTLCTMQIWGRARYVWRRGELEDGFGDAEDEEDEAKAKVDGEDGGGLDEKGDDHDADRKDGDHYADGGARDANVALVAFFILVIRHSMRHGSPTNARTNRHERTIDRESESRYRLATLKPLNFVKLTRRHLPAAPGPDPTIRPRDISTTPSISAGPINSRLRQFARNISRQLARRIGLSPGDSCGLMDVNRGGADGGGGLRRTPSRRRCGV